MQGPGLPSYGAEYGYLADSGSVETIDYKTGSTTTAASSTTSYLSDRNLIDEIDNVAGTGTISKYDYTYNAIGQRTHVVNTGTAFSANAHNAYGYNDRRVEKEVFEWTGTWTSTGVERFVYDEWTQRGSAKMDSGKPEPQGRSAAGCPLGGKRVNLLLVLDGANSNQVLEKYTWGLDIAEQASGLPRGGRPGAAAGGVGGLLAVEQVSGSNSGDYVYFYDANGNVAQVLDWDSETIAAHYEYDPFGRIVHSTGSYDDENRFRFSTKFSDPETELYYYGFRFYSPGQGRFLNRDPIGELGGLNLYAFVGNDPVNAWDYLGLTDAIDCDSYIGSPEFAALPPHIKLAILLACMPPQVTCPDGCEPVIPTPILPPPPPPDSQPPGAPPSNGSDFDPCNPPPCPDDALKEHLKEKALELLGELPKIGNIVPVYGAAAGVLNAACTCQDFQRNPDDQMACHLCCRSIADLAPGLNVFHICLDKCY